MLMEKQRYYTLEEFKQNMLKAIDEGKKRRDIEIMKENTECFAKETEENLEFQDEL